MAEASRFPQLALPFAITGAAGGWLSAGLVTNPLVWRAAPGTRGAATLAGAIFAALAGAVITRLCTRQRLSYQLDDDEQAPPWTDSRLLQAAVVLAAGAATGAIVAWACDAYNGPAIGALGGLFCGGLFLPVCFAVIAAGRKARRARLGSLVADSDRRAVWGILAAALSVATLEALPDWPAHAAGAVPKPLAVAGMLAFSGMVLAAAMVLDARALRRAGQATSPGLVAQDPERAASAGATVPTLDLGLGEEVGARVHRAAAAYRGTDRMLALVVGDPDQALSALRRALRRGRLGLALAGAVACAHAAAAHSPAAQLLYDERRCMSFETESCVRAADALRRVNPMRAVTFYQRACGVASVEACVALGEIYDDADPERADHYFDLACRLKDRRGCLHFTN